MERTLARLSLTNVCIIKFSRNVECVFEYKTAILNVFKLRKLH